MDALSKLPEEMDHLVNSFLSQAIVGDTTVGFTQYIFWMFVAIALLCVVIFVFKKKQAASLAPKGLFVNGVEYVIEFARDDMCKSILGDTWKKHFPFIASLFFFILFNNIVGVIPGCHPGTGTMGVTTALALVSFVYFIVVGVKRMGPIGYLKSLAPEGIAFPASVPLWLIELFSTFLRLITLAVRLFCNMFAGHVVMGAFAILASLFVEPLLQSFTVAALPGAATSIFWMLILIVIYAVELMVAAIQAYVFTLLSAVYIQLVENE
ncbi:F0F1 ATP synthase subunit A [Olsenella intestinalis]|uniref:F0F1 ATP synthase subunit A n=1 Tax=Olsenella intestinalis TaxID=2930083 RepID=UPI0020100C60